MSIWHTVVGHVQFTWISKQMCTRYLVTNGRKHCLFLVFNAGCSPMSLWPPLMLLKDYSVWPWPICFKVYEIITNNDDFDFYHLSFQILSILYLELPLYNGIRCGLTPGFVNYKKKCNRLVAANDQVLPVACPWSVVLSGYSGFFHH